jgi:hypothetical protein
MRNHECSNPFLLLMKIGCGVVFSELSREVPRRPGRLSGHEAEKSEKKSSAPVWQER